MNALKKIKIGKAAGLDDIAVEILKCGNVIVTD